MKLLKSKFVDQNKLSADVSKEEREKYDPFLNKHPYAIPLVMTSQGDVIREAHGFLLEKDMFSRSSSKTKTAETYGESLTGWLEFCNLNEINWRCAPPKSLIIYRNFMKSARGPGMKPLSANTINLRLTVSLEFTKYCLSCLSGDMESSSILRKLQKLSSMRVYIRKSQSHPIALSRTDCKQLKNRLKSPHKIIFSWGLLTGLRISTVLGIKLDTFLKVRNEGGGGFIDVVTKGGKHQKVYIPKLLLDETYAYVEIERKLQILRKYRRFSDSDADSLFLNHNAAPVTRECYYVAYKRACKFLGVKSHPHQARTTFATFMEKTLRVYGKENSIDHIKIVQGLLGHSSSETTMRYIESLQVNDTDVLALLEVNSRWTLADHG